MDIVTAVLMMIVGTIFISSGIFEFKLLCIVDWIGTLVGLLMVLIGVTSVFGWL